MLCVRFACFHDVEGQYMRLREIRKSRNYKVQDIANYLCCLASVYSRYESGAREPSIDVLIKLSALYGVSVDYLIGNDEFADTSMTEDEAELVKAMRLADKRACCDALTLLRLHPANK